MKTRKRKNIGKTDTQKGKKEQKRKAMKMKVGSVKCVKKIDRKL